MKKYTSVWPMMVLMLAIGSSLLLFGCGGGSGSGDGATSSVDGTITGTAVKGPVSGATVTAYAINNGVMGAQIGNRNDGRAGEFHRLHRRLLGSCHAADERGDLYG